MDLAEIRHARQRISDHIVRTPLKQSVTLSAITGAQIGLKFENQQFTAWFKERGALNCLLQLSIEEQRRGVIAMSAGNHAQAVAYHGARLNIPTCIVMPRSTPNVKVDQTRILGAEVHLEGSHFDETRAFTDALAAERNLVLVHPYDDPRVIAGQGTLGLEILEQAPDVDVVVVPVGGGGLITGVATALKALRPEVEVLGVQVEGFDAVYQAFHRRPSRSRPCSTVAEGIAVKSPGQRTMPRIQTLVDDMLLVDEEAAEQAVFRLIEVEKAVVEGAGAVGLAAVLSSPDRFERRNVVLPLCGGNIDMMVLASILQRGMVRTGRLKRVKVEIPDLPGSLAGLTRALAELNSNIIDIQQRRTFEGSSVRDTVVEVSLQMRGEEQVSEVLAGLRARDYKVSLA